jgi:hypothetical protein
MPSAFETEEGRMKPLIKWGAIAALLAGVMEFVIAIVRIFFSPGPVLQLYSSVDYLQETSLAIALLASAVMLVALDTLQRGSSDYGRLGDWGFGVAVISVVLILLSRPVSLLILDHVLLIPNTIGDYTRIVGLILLGAATLRAGVLPQWCGLLIILGFLLSQPLGIVGTILGDRICVGGVRIAVERGNPTPDASEGRVGAL